MQPDHKTARENCAIKRFKNILLFSDQVVMGTVCRTGLAGFFIGNTAESVLQQVNCSVLVLKPEGFVSPVKLEEA